MPSFNFDKYVAAVGYSEPDSIRITQSDTLGGIYVQVGVDQFLAGLPDNPEDATQSVVTEALADTAKFTRMAFVTVADVIGDTAILEPKIATPDSFQIFAYSKDAGLGVVADVVLDIAPIGGYTTAGDNTVVERAEDSSDVAGRASIDNIPADSGKYNVNFGGHKKIVDSTGRGGTSINWKDVADE